MKIKLIANGSSKWERLIHRWGVSFLIGEDVVFDTFGDPGVLLNNIHRFNIDITNIKHIVISHDDWDHISGLWYLIYNRKDIAVYVCPGFREDIKDRIRSFGVQLVEVAGSILIKEGIYSTGQLCSESEGLLIYEQSLTVKTAKGLVIITGCAHPGIISIVDNIRKKFNENIYFVIGGLHLKDKPITQIREVISRLKSSGTEKIAPLHCTGEIAQRLFKEAYGDNCLSLKIGETLEL